MLKLNQYPTPIIILSVRPLVPLLLFLPPSNKNGLGPWVTKGEVKIPEEPPTELWSGGPLHFPVFILCLQNVEQYSQRSADTQSGRHIICAQKNLS